MSRLSQASRESIPQDQVEIFDALIKQYGQSKNGPPSIVQHVPKGWRIERDMRDYLRYESSLSAEIVELGILVAAREVDCQYVWAVHAPLAREAGLTPEFLEALRERKEFPPLSDKYVAVINYCREFFRTHRGSPGTYAMLKEQFGERGVVELGMLFGSYCMLAILLSAADVQLRPNQDEPVLPIF